MTDLERAAAEVRRLYRERGWIGPREAHDAWRWPLVALGWTQGELDEAAKTHPLMCSFDQLSTEDQTHALLGLEASNAESDDRDRTLERIEVKR